MTATSELLKTPLTTWHAAQGAVMADFAGWSMPIRYSTITEEHNATRNSIGIFDVSHMGRFSFEAPDAGNALDRLTTRKVAEMPVGRIRYSLMCKDDGGILDDVLVYRLADTAGNPKFSMVVNAGNRTKIASWLEQQLSLSELGFKDRTTETAMIAVQGPKANEMMHKLCNIDPNELKYYTGVTTTICGYEGILSRTGYTGEDGCEIIVDANVGEEIWQEIHDAGLDIGLKPAGLGARDTLRLEAAMPLYGHELSEDMNPAQADLAFAISLKDRDFVGKGPIEASMKDPGLRKRVCIVLEGKRPAREHCPVVVDGNAVGEITSGTVSPTLGKPIAMAMIDGSFTTPGTKVEIDIRGKSAPAMVVKTPFYSASK